MVGMQSGGGAPVCLIRGGREGLCVAEEGISIGALYGSIRMCCGARMDDVSDCNGHSFVVAQARTGKSFFLNQLTRTKHRVAQVATAAANGSNGEVIASQLNGFRVGPTTESCTRGIWLWDPQPSIRNARGDKVLFMDTEGIAATDNDESYDAKIFSLGLLLSSLFVFNTMGVIDEGAIDRLFLVSELTKHVCVSANTGHQPSHANTTLSSSLDADQDDMEAAEDGAGLKDSMAESRELAPHFPPFIWLLRDFMLDMQQDGASLSPNEYLEKSLEPRDANSRRNEERNKIRKSIQILFARRECLTLVRPVMDELQLRRAAELLEEQLRPEFVHQMEKIRDRILAVVAPKQLFGKVMDGAKLAHLVKCYTETMNSGSVPDIRAAWEYVSEATCQTALMNAADAYDTMIVVMNQESDDNDSIKVKILSQQEFEKIHKDAQDEALTIFKNQSVEGATRAVCFQKLKQHIQKQKSAQIALLQRRSTDFCEQVLVDLRRKFLQQPMEDRVWEKKFLSPSADTKSNTVMNCDTRSQAVSFESTIDALEEIYEKQAQGPSKKIVFYNFLRKETIVYFQTLFQRLSEGHSTAQSKWERSYSDLQHEQQTHELEWKQQLETKHMEITLLRESKAHAEEKERMQNNRIAELQQQAEQQAHAISTLEEKKRSVKAELDDLEMKHSQLEKELDKAQLNLDHKETSLREYIEGARQMKQELNQQLEAARESHQDEKEEWIKKFADQSAEKNGLQKQLKQREHELQQKQLDLELSLKELEQLRQEFNDELEAKNQKVEECRQLRELNTELETQLEDTLTFQSSMMEDAEREKTRLQMRLERYQTQLGSLESDREVDDVLKECVSEVVRLAEVDKIRTVQEEKELLQEQLGELYLKISTLPDFYQREIFCSAEPTPDFFEALTS